MYSKIVNQHRKLVKSGITLMKKFLKRRIKSKKPLILYKNENLIF